MSIGRALDTLHKAMKNLVEHPELIIDEDYMMGMFDEYIEELPPLKEYWTFMFDKKQMSVVSRNTGAKVLHIAQLRSELFHPKNQTNKDSDSDARVIELMGNAGAPIFVREMEDIKKQHGDIFLYPDPNIRMSILQLRGRRQCLAVSARRILWRAALVDAHIKSNAMVALA